MNPGGRDDYLVTEVMTAAPQQLQLMLIEAALRQAQRARLLYQERRELEAGDSLVKAQEIVTQLIAGVKPEADPKLARQVIGVYGFVFRTLVAAHLERSDKKLAEAVSILEIERDTWRQMCQKLGGRNSDPAAGLPPAARGSSAAAARPHIPLDGSLDSSTSFVA